MPFFFRASLQAFPSSNKQIYPQQKKERKSNVRALQFIHQQTSISFFEGLGSVFAQALFELPGLFFIFSQAVCFPRSSSSPSLLLVLCLCDVHWFFRWRDRRFLLDRCRILLHFPSGRKSPRFLLLFALPLLRERLSRRRAPAARQKILK